MVTGGARSGKSRYAHELAARFERRAFVATAEPLDEEMRERIRSHREERGEGWSTVEEPVDLAGALDRLPAATEVAVIDCLTVWLGNLLHRTSGAGAAAGGIGGERSGAPSALSADGRLDRRPGDHFADFPGIAAFLARIEAPSCPLIVVSNEVGWGIVPENPLARAFRDLAGRLNEEVARRADRVVLMVCGRPLELPGGRVG